MGLLWQAAAVNVWHVNLAARLFNECNRRVAGIFEEQFHGAAFEVGDAFHLAEIHGAFGSWFGEHCWTAVLHGFWCCVVGWQQAAGETWEL